MTGHGGGFCTIHANSVIDAFDRIEGLVQLANYPVVPKTIAKAVHLVVGLRREPGGPRRVTEMAYVHGWKGDEYQLEFVEPEW
jgi:Flp pilus assembly CpaF family ATPase